MADNINYNPFGNVNNSSFNLNNQNLNPFEVQPQNQNPNQDNNTNNVEEFSVAIFGSTAVLVLLVIALMMLTYASHNDTTLIRTRSDDASEEYTIEDDGDMIHQLYMK